MLRKELEISDDAKVSTFTFYDILSWADDSWLDFAQVEEEAEDESTDEKADAPADEQDEKKEEL